MHPKVKPHTFGIPWRMPPYFKHRVAVELSTKPGNFVRINQRIYLCGSIVFRNFVKFTVLGPHSPPLTDGTRKDMKSLICFERVHQYRTKMKKNKESIWLS